MWEKHFEIPGKDIDQKEHVSLFSHACPDPHYKKGRTQTKTPQSQEGPQKSSGFLHTQGNLWEQLGKGLKVIFFPMAGSEESHRPVFSFVLYPLNSLNFLNLSLLPLLTLLILIVQNSSSRRFYIKQPFGFSVTSSCSLQDSEVLLFYFSFALNPLGPNPFESERTCNTSGLWLRPSESERTWSGSQPSADRLQKLPASKQILYFLLMNPRLC